MNTDLFDHIYGYRYESRPEVSDCAPPSTGPLYYYTTVETFQKIAETGSIFASHIKRMNDWKEFDIGADRVLAKMKIAIDGRKKDICREINTAPSGTWPEPAEKGAKEKKKKQADNLLHYYRVPFLESAIHGCGRCHRYIENDELQMYRFGEDGVYGMDYAFPELYSISFTSQQDLLSQWKMYARESGVAIEFDFAGMGARLSLLQGVLTDGKDGKDFSSPCTYPRPIIYEFEDITLPLNVALNSQKIFSNVPYYKDTGFSQESEARLIFRPYKKLEGGKTICSKLGYRTANHLLVPYLVIYCAEEGKPEKLGWPIVSLTVGPGHNQDAVFEGLVHFVEYGALKLCQFTEEELMRARVRYYHEFFASLDMAQEAAPPHTGRDDWRKKAGKAAADIQCQGITSALEQERFLYARGQEELCTEEQRPQYSTAFQAFCAHTYLASNGIIIRKSKIPYIFN